jgi:hypothetical protein
MSGFESAGSEGGPAGSGPDGSGSASESAGDVTDSGEDTLGEGDLRGILTFTFYPQDAVTDQDIVGMAGAWPGDEQILDTVDDFFGVWGLETFFPPPPVDLDALQHDGFAVGFDWGSPTDWLLAGTAMKLALADDSGAAQACLLYLGGSPEVEFPPNSGTMAPNYPIYASTDSSLQPAGCMPEAMNWQPDADYDLVLYGGELFETNVLPARVHTPPAFEVSAPAFGEFQTPLDQSADLEVRWDGEGNPDDRIVIRVWDMFGRMFTVHATDDGSYTIAADALGQLDVGPATITVARERIEPVPFTDGVIKVVTRYERWGYFDLY